MILRATIRQLGRWWRRVRGRRLGPPRPVTARSARNGSVALAYDVRGQGPPLVLIQGLGIGRWGWEPVADRLARRFRVITLDNRGTDQPWRHGRPDAGPCPS